MSSIFNLLYALHPWAPVLFLVLLANGMLAPALYTLRTRRPFDLQGLRAKVKAGDAFSKYVYFSWLALAVPVIVIVCVLLGSLLLK